MLHPGQLIARELKHRGRTQQYFADLIERKQVEVSYLVRGKRNLNPERALRIATAFGTSQEFWLNLQAQYDMDVQKENPDLQSLVKRITQRVIKLSPEPQLVK